MGGGGCLVCLGSRCSRLVLLRRTSALPTGFDAGQWAAVLGDVEGGLLGVVAERSLSQVGWPFNAHVDHDPPRRGREPKKRHQCVVVNACRQPRSLTIHSCASCVLQTWSRLHKLRDCYKKS